MKKPSIEQLKLSDDEYQTLKKVSYLAPARPLPKRMQQWHIDNNIPIPEVRLCAINHCAAKIGTELYDKLHALYDRNMVRIDGYESKTALKHNKIDVSEYGEWVAFYIGGGTFGHQAIKLYEEGER